MQGTGRDHPVDDRHHSRPRSESRARPGRGNCVIGEISSRARRYAPTLLMTQLAMPGDAYAAGGCGSRRGRAEGCLFKEISSRVEPGRRGFRLGLSVSPRFLWECLNSPSMARFSRPAHRTGLADFPHPALRLGSVRLRHAGAPPADACPVAADRVASASTGPGSAGSPARGLCDVAPETSAAACRCTRPAPGRPR